MHEAPHFETTPSPRAKLIHPWEQEHFNQTRVSSLLLQGACNPELRRFFSYTQTSVHNWLPSLSSPKSCSTLAPHRGKPAPALLHVQVTQSPPSPAFLLGMSRPFACCLPMRCHGSRAGSQLTIPNPLQFPSCWKESLMGSSNPVSDGEVGGSKAGGQPLVDTCRNRRGRSREGGEVMKYAQNLVLNRCSRTSLLMVFLYLAHKKKKVLQDGKEAFSHLFPPKKNCRSVLHHCIAPSFSTWSRQRRKAVYLHH